MLPQCQALMMIMRRAILIVDDDIGMMSTAAQYSHLGCMLCHGIPPLCSIPHPLLLHCLVCRQWCHHLSLHVIFDVFTDVDVSKSYSGSWLCCVPLYSSSNLLHLQLGFPLHIWLVIIDVINFICLPFLSSLMSPLIMKSTEQNRFALGHVLHSISTSPSLPLLANPSCWACLILKSSLNLLQIIEESHCHGLEWVLCIPHQISPLQFLPAGLVLTAVITWMESQRNHIAMHICTPSVGRAVYFSPSKRSSSFSNSTSP